MGKHISGEEFKAKLLARRDQQAEPVLTADAWLAVLGSVGNRELLSIIGGKKPQSIGELSEAAGRAQPNVSRSLSALMNAGLVTITSNGRTSVPSLTEFGRQKAIEAGLLRPLDVPSVGQSVTDGATAQISPYLVASLRKGSEGELGHLCLNAPIQGQVVVGTSKEDLMATTYRLLDHWWRVLYRRDAPYKVGAFSLDGNEELTLLIRSTGPRIERWLRPQRDSLLSAMHSTVGCSAFEQELLNAVIRPVSYARFDERLSSKLSRLDDSYTEPAELEFCRTAGALNMTPYDLTDSKAQRVRELISSMPDEDTRLDFASVVLIDEIDAASARIREGIARSKESNALSAIPHFASDLRSQISMLANSAVRPWQKGTSAAKVLRSHLGLAPDVSVGDASQLARLCGAKDFATYNLESRALRAFQERVSGSPRVLVQEGSTPQSTAFVLARAIGDYLVFQSEKSCVAKTYSDRQAVGRAFAAEFMAPAEGVIAMIDENEQSTTKVAEYYQVPFDVVTHQYGNNNYARFQDA